MRHLFLLTVTLLLSANPSFAQEDKSDHPLITAYEGSNLRKKEVIEFDEYKAFTGHDEEGGLTGPTLEGKITKLSYKNPSNRSTLEIIRNYESALENAGAEILFACNQSEYECATQYAQSALGKYNGISSITNTNGRYIIGKVRKDGHTAYAAIAVGPISTIIHVVEVKEMEIDKVSVDADALGSDLDENGYVILDGIYFDTDKTTLKENSAPALGEVKKLLMTRPDLKLYVVGHTDMQGALAYNMNLSKGRAQAVVTELVSKYGVDGERLESHGVGPLSPQASNTSDSGQAKNRRVVLVAR